MTPEKEQRIRKRLQRASFLRSKMTSAKASMHNAINLQDISKDPALKDKWIKKELYWIERYKTLKAEYNNL